MQSMYFLQFMWVSLKSIEDPMRSTSGLLQKQSDHGIIRIISSFLLKWLKTVKKGKQEDDIKIKRCYLM